MSAPVLEVDVIVECPGWPQDAEHDVRRAIAATAAVEGCSGRAVVLLTDDAAVRRLNATWRGLDKPTNVLSFPAPSSDPVGALGDIAIAYETTAREARDENKPLAHHLMHLSVHGFLHLLGHDHADDAQAEAMEQRERDILATLGVPDPYLTHADAQA